MANYQALAEQMVAPIYNQLEQGATEQIKAAETDPYYDSLLKGLDATKERSFGQIEGRAAGRGYGYGSIIGQQQGAYLGEKYLPAVADVKKTQLDRINSLKQTLAELRSKRAGAVLDQSNMLRQEDISAQEAAMNRAASTASSASSMSEWQTKQLARNELAQEALA
jgi:hypothetical protein